MGGESHCHGSGDECINHEATSPPTFFFLLGRSNVLKCLFSTVIYELFSGSKCTVGRQKDPIPGTNTVNMTLDIMLFEACFLDQQLSRSPQGTEYLKHNFWSAGCLCDAFHIRQNTNISSRDWQDSLLRGVKNSSRRSKEKECGYVYWQTMKNRNQKNTITVGPR